MRFLFDRPYIVDATKFRGRFWSVGGCRGFLLGAIPNLMSRSMPERYVMAPLALLMSGLTAIVALG
jgi:hypothetical protein